MPHPAYARDIDRGDAGKTRRLELRSEYGMPQTTLTDPARYYDAQYHDAATR